MPWSSAEADKFKKGLSKKSKDKWSNVANSVLSESGDEGKAVRIANSVTKAAVKRRLTKNIGG